MTFFHLCTKCNRPMVETKWGRFVHYFMTTCANTHAYYHPSVNEFVK